MLGEPVFKYEVSYELSSCLYLRKVYGQQVVGSGRKVCQSPSNVHGRNALSAHQNVRISDMDIAIAVYSNKDLAALGLGSKWPRIARQPAKYLSLKILCELSLLTLVHQANLVKAVSMSEAVQIGIVHFYNSITTDLASIEISREHSIQILSGAVCKQLVRCTRQEMKMR